jgi:TldD protein
MFPLMKSILSRMDSDYGDMRYEIKRETVIVFNGKELTQIGSNSTDGYVLRALKRGGLSSMAFTRETDSEKALRTIEGNCLLIAHRIREPIRFVKAGAIQDTSLPELEEDPRQVPMDEKLELTRRYNSLPLGYEGVATTITGYSEIIREKYFLNTEGTEIREDLVTTRLSCSITSKDGNLIQNVRLGLGA